MRHTRGRVDEVETLAESRLPRRYLDHGAGDKVDGAHVDSVHHAGRQAHLDAALDQPD
jgi:hypothetical protein